MPSPLMSPVIPSDGTVIGQGDPYPFLYQKVDLSGPDDLVVKLLGKNEACSYVLHREHHYYLQESNNLLWLLPLSLVIIRHIL